MPCVCDGYPPSEHEIRQAKAYRLLCSILERAEEQMPSLITCCDELNAWWQEHKKWDAEKREREIFYERLQREKKEKEFELLRKELGK